MRVCGSLFFSHPDHDDPRIDRPAPLLPSRCGRARPCRAGRRLLRDPADPSRLDPAYDSGDHLHPNEAGYRVMAQQVDLRLLRP
jgi:hypothetical protein